MQLYECEPVVLKARLVAVNLKELRCPVETGRAWYGEKDEHDVGSGELNTSLQGGVKGWQVE